MICYHHNDIDGRAAGYLVHKMKPSTIEDYPQNYIEMTYNDKFDKHTMKDDVIMVDLSFSESTYQSFIKICKTARTVTWIDHHKSSIEVIENHKEELQAIRNLTYLVSDCACGSALTYSYFSIPRNELQSIRNTENDEYYKITAKFDSDSNNSYVTVSTCKYKKTKKDQASVNQYKYKLPKWLMYVDDFDCWKNIYKETNSIFLGIDSNNTNLVDNTSFNNFWDELSSNEEEIKKLFVSGNAIKKYLFTKYDKELIDTFEWRYGDTKFLCKNSTGNLWNFRDKIKDYEAVILFSYKGSSGKWGYSVYSDENSDFDCSKFCSIFGGGGHFHASGFSTDHCIFVNKEDILEPTICINGLVSIRDKFEKCIKDNTVAKEKGIKCFEPTNKSNRKTFHDFEIDVDYRDRKQIPKIDLVVASISSIRDREDFRNFYHIIKKIIDNKHGQIFLAIIDDIENENNNLHNEDDLVIDLDFIENMIKFLKGYVIHFSGEDPIKSISTRVSYII